MFFLFYHDLMLIFAGFIWPVLKDFYFYYGKYLVPISQKINKVKDEIYIFKEREI